MQRSALREVLFDVIGLVLTARLVVEVDPESSSAERVADLLDEADQTLSRARALVGVAPMDRADG